MTEKLFLLGGVVGLLLYVHEKSKPAPTLGPPLQADIAVVGSRLPDLHLPAIVPNIDEQPTLYDQYGNPSIGNVYMPNPIWSAKKPPSQTTFVKPPSLGTGIVYDYNSGMPVAMHNTM